MPDKNYNGYFLHITVNMPIKSFDLFVNYYSSQGFTGKALWKRIIKGAGTPRASTNAMFGIF